MRRFLLILLLVLPGLAAAQEDDGTVLSRLIEDQLSDGAGRQVSIQGFRGALSAQATLARMTISDAEGPWLILENATLDWTRSALLSGELLVNALTAERLEIIRQPIAEDGLDLPTAETQPFSLPDLPVRVEIDRFEIETVVLGPDLFGLAATLSVEGTGRLSGGTGAADISLRRLDGPEGLFALDASYDNADRMLDLSLQLEEAEGGLAAELLGLPGRPDLSLSIAGAGPIDEFTADITLATEGQDRITGQVVSTLAAEGETRVTADIGGDIRPLLLPDYHAFFGEDVRLRALVRQIENGGTRLEELSLQSTALSLTGQVALDQRGLPLLIDIDGAIRPEDGGTVRLPIGAAAAELGSADLSLGYDRALGEAFTLNADLNSLQLDDAQMANAALSLDGAIAITDAGLQAITAEMSTAMRGVAHSDPGLSQAVGPTLDIVGALSWVNGAPFILSDLIVASEDMRAEGGASVNLHDSRIDVTLGVEVTADDIDRFALLAGQPLDGYASLAVTGQIEALSGEVDLSISGLGRDLRFIEGLPADLFAGDTALGAQITRGPSGITVEDIRLENAELSLNGQASISSGDTSAEAAFDLREVGLFTDILAGPVSVDATLERQGTSPFDVGVALTGPNDIAANVTGTVDGQTTDFALSLVAQARDIDPGNGVPTQLLAGLTELSLQANRTGGVTTLGDIDLSGSELAATGSASFGPDTSRVEVDARLANVGLFTDALSGAVTADAVLTRSGDDPWQVASDLTGPGGMRAALAGQVGLPDGQVDLSASGQAPLALANRFIAPRSISGTAGFDLSMRGAPGLGSLSGTLRSSDARVSVPTYAVAVENLGLTAQISGGQTSLTANGTFSTGGQVNAQGSINLGTSGMDGTITVALRNARFVDPTLYEANVATADLTVSGALARAPQITGQVTLGESEIRVPEASLAGTASIPDIRHVGESREARLTRSFAGLLGNSAGSGSGSNTTGLDITVTAPGRIFLRGRGIDAEFGGSIRLFGTTANVIPTGQFDLIRGRLSVLGTRLDFVEGQATLQGSFDPFLRLAATSRASGYQITISVIGPASGPEITFSSDPSLPEDEVLAQLLFGRSVSGLSPLQLLQLADAATSLAGGSTNSGFIAGLRDGLGLDDLDLSTDEEGNAAVTAGRYLSENIYTDVTVNAEGDADISLNIDLTPNITARGSVGSDGGSSIGIFFEQDY